MDSELLKQVSIPVFTGVIGYIINWTGVWPASGCCFTRSADLLLEGVLAGPPSGFSHVVRRSIRMTPLGDDFCEVALPLNTAEFVALGAAMVPDRSARAPE